MIGSRKTFYRIARQVLKSAKGYRKKIAKYIELPRPTGINILSDNYF